MSVNPAVQSSLANAVQQLSAIDADCAQIEGAKANPNPGTPQEIRGVLDNIATCAKSVVDDPNVPANLKIAFQQVMQDAQSQNYNTNKVFEDAINAGRALQNALES